jgi:hypothetical protein
LGELVSSLWDRETERQRDRCQTTERERERERQRYRETERQRYSDTAIQRETERQTDRETERQRDREYLMQVPSFGKSMAVRHGKNGLAIERTFVFYSVSVRLKVGRRIGLDFDVLAVCLAVARERRNRSDVVSAEVQGRV